MFLILKNYIYKNYYLLKFSSNKMEYYFIISQILFPYFVLLFLFIYMYFFWIVIYYFIDKYYIKTYIQSINNISHLQIRNGA
jgi:hypothetical protein